MIKIDTNLTPEELESDARRVFAAAGPKIHSLAESWNPAEGSPTITREGRYVNRAWSEWTQGFQYGLALYQYDALGDEAFLEIGIDGIRNCMAPHLTHLGVHDHGFTNTSSYGNLLRLMNEGRVVDEKWLREYLVLALKVSGSVQAARWTPLADDLGYVYSAFGPHCLFTDTIRSMRSLALAYRLGHRLMGEGDRSISLLRRLLQHAETTIRYCVYRGEGRDIWDEAGRVSHQALFNTNDGSFHCPNTQQGFSPYSTWTRAQSWALLGFAELAEFILETPDQEIAVLGLDAYPDVAAAADRFIGTARLIADHVIDHACIDGISYWDTAAPGLVHMPGYAERPADPYNRYEPVDSPTAAINAQGFLRLARLLEDRGDMGAAVRYRAAGLTTARTLFGPSYLSEDPAHQGLLLHSVYSRPKGWDRIASGQNVPNGEASMWGDYHVMELAVYLVRFVDGDRYLRFF